MILNNMMYIIKVSIGREIVLLFYAIRCDIMVEYGAGQHSSGLPEQQEPWVTPSSPQLILFLEELLCPSTQETSICNFAFIIDQKCVREAMSSHDYDRKLFSTD